MYHQYITTKDNFELPITIIEATGSQAKGVVVYYHGGGLIFGQPNDLPQAYQDLITTDYHLVMLSYRLAPESNIDTIIADALAGLDFVAQLYPELPLILFGRSAGAYLALQVASQRQVAGIMDFYGYSRVHVPSFLRPHPTYQTLSTQVSADMLQQLIQDSPLVTGPMQARYPIYLHARGAAQWLNYLGMQTSTDSAYNLAPKQLQQLPPTFIVHCSGDPDVPISESDYLAQHIPVTQVKRLALDEHDFDRTVNDYNIAIYQECLDFLATLTN